MGLSLADFLTCLAIPESAEYLTNCFGAARRGDVGEVIAAAVKFAVVLNPDPEGGLIDLPQLAARL